MTKKIISILALAFAIALPTQINTHAEDLVIKNQLIVTAKSGLNVRDQNCNRVETLSYGTQLYSDTLRDQLYCTIQGKSLKMVYVSYFPDR